MCLHWGWLRGETYLDPLLLVGAGPMRLLPLWQQTGGRIEDAARRTPSPRIGGGETVPPVWLPEHYRWLWR